MNDIAPKGKEGLFLGFANATVGIGWFIGSLLAGSLYETGGDKVNLALQEVSSTRDSSALVQLLTEEELQTSFATFSSDPAPEGEALRQAILLQSATEGFGEEGGDEKWITEQFHRSRVMEMASAEAGMDEAAFKQLLWDKYEPYSMWLIFALIGVGSGVLLMIYDWGVRRYDAKHPVAA